MKLLFMVSWSAGSGECFFSLVHPHTVIMAASWRLGRALVMRQSTEAFRSLSCPLRSRGSRVKSGASFRLSCTSQSLFVCLGVAYEYSELDSSGDDFLRGSNAWFDSGFQKYFTHFLRGGRLES